MSDKTIYNINLHETIVIKRLGNIIHEVTRVPGGWIYRTLSENKNHEVTVSSCFVPYNNEYFS